MKDVEHKDRADLDEQFRLPIGMTRDDVQANAEALIGGLLT